MKKKFRIKKTKEIDAIIKNKVRSGNKFFVIYYKENNLNHFRLAISIGRKYGIAVLRNKMKRQIRETFRTPNFKNYDLVVVVKKEAALLTFQEIKTNLNNLFKNLIENGERE